MLEQEDDEVPPLDPKKVAVFILLLGMIAFAGWRYWRAQAAVAAVAEASKDYRKLFPSRSAEPPPPPPQPVVTAAAPVSGMMLQIDADMRAPKKVPPAAPPEAAPPAAVAKVEAPAPVKPAKKAFNQPRLNSGGFSGLNGGSGITYSGRSLSGTGAPAAPAAANPAAPAMPNIPGMPAVPAADQK